MCQNLREFRGVQAPCGKCVECVTYKAYVYRMRIQVECSASKKSWFVTLTLRKNMSESVGYRLVQRYLKRLRKVSSLKLRYACVAERGPATGRLHYHMVLHGPTSLTERMVRKPWRGGISEATLIRSGDAQHVAQYSVKIARYVTKARGAGRFRFSLGYGSLPLKTPMVEMLRDLWPDARFRVGGVLVPRRLLPVRGFVSVFSEDQHADADECRKAYHDEKQLKSERKRDRTNKMLFREEPPAGLWGSEL